MVHRDGSVLADRGAGATLAAPPHRIAAGRRATPCSRGAAGRGASVRHVAWALITGALGCNAIFGVDALHYGPRGDAGEGGTAGAAAATTSSTTGAGGSTGTTVTTTTSSSSSTSGTGAAAGAGGGENGGTGGASLMSCNEQYGLLEGYQLCGESYYSCELDIGFGAYSSCDDLCALGGGSCAHAVASDGECGMSGPGFNCGVTGPELWVCSCSRGCDGQPPCIPPALCTGGQCT